MTSYRYTIQLVKLIADSYDTFEPDKLGGEGDCSLIEYKSDFDNAFDKLEQDEQKFILSRDSLDVYYRDMALKKLTKILNGEWKVKYELSKSLQEGEIVSVRRSKFIRASHFSKPFGVYTQGGKRITLTLDGEKIETPLPAGVVIYGQIHVRG